MLKWCFLVALCYFKLYNVSFIWLHDEMLPYWYLAKTQHNLTVIWQAVLALTMVEYCNISTMNPHGRQLVSRNLITTYNIRQCNAHEASTVIPTCISLIYWHILAKGTRIRGYDYFHHPFFSTGQHPPLCRCSCVLQILYVFISFLGKC